MVKDNLKSLVGYSLVILAALSIVAVLVVSMKQQAPAPALNSARAAERAKALADSQSAAEVEVNSYATLDAAKGVYRLKVSQAVSITEQLYRANPSAARSNLVARAEKAHFVPPVVAPPTFE